MKKQKIAYMFTNVNDPRDKYVSGNYLVQKKMVDGVESVVINNVVRMQDFAGYEVGDLKYGYMSYPTKIG